MVEKVRIEISGEALGSSAGGRCRDGVVVRQRIYRSTADGRLRRLLQPTLGAGKNRRRSCIARRRAVDPRSSIANRAGGYGAGETREMTVRDVVLKTAARADIRNHVGYIAADS